MTTKAELIARVAELEHHIKNMDLIVADKLGETRLMRAGPGEEGFEIEMAGGPLALLAEYLVQMMQINTENPLNYFEVEVHPKNRFDPMVINIQRVHGKRPAQLHGEAKKEIEELKEELAWYRSFVQEHDLYGQFDDYKSHYEADGIPNS